MNKQLLHKTKEFVISRTCMIDVNFRLEFFHKCKINWINDYYNMSRWMWIEDEEVKGI
jgi:hypothetical protein